MRIDTSMPKAWAEEMDAAWNGWVQEARAALPSQEQTDNYTPADTYSKGPVNIDDLLFLERLYWPDIFSSEAGHTQCAEAADAKMGRSSSAARMLAEAFRRTPPVILPCKHVRKELEAQAAYIGSLEQAVRRGEKERTSARVHRSPSADSRRLREENRLLHAKVEALEKQLQSAHARSLRGERVNSEWRAQLHALRQSEAKLRQELQAARASHGSARAAAQASLSSSHATESALRDALRQAKEKLALSESECAELQRSVVHLRAMLSQTMRCMTAEAEQAHG